MRLLLTSVLVLILAACSGAPQSDSLKDPLPGAPDGTLAASVNGRPLSNELVEAFARSRGLDVTLAEQRKQAVDGLVDGLLLAQDAIDRGLLDSSDRQAEAALAKMQYLAALAIADYRDALEIDDARVFEHYQQEAQRAGNQEWRLEHILFADEAAALEAARRAGEPDADFGSLMQEYSTVARQARSLDWATPTRLPPELAEVAKSLPDGMVAPAPIQTSFGWHVLRRAESRPFTPPAFDTVKEAARGQLIERALEDYLAGLRGKAEIATSASTASPQG